MTGELTKEQVEQLLSSQALGRLACCNNNQPYIVPITYAYDGEFIYGHTNEGAKLNAMRVNPNVCFEVDIMNSMVNWKSALVYGQFEELDAEEAEKARGYFFNKVFPLLTSSTVHAHQHEVTSRIDDRNRVKFVMFRIRITKMTGRYEKQ